MSSHDPAAPGSSAVPSTSHARRSVETAWPTVALKCRSFWSPSDLGACRKKRWNSEPVSAIQKSTPTRQAVSAWLSPSIRSWRRTHELTLEDDEHDEQRMTIIAA